MKDTRLDSLDRSKYLQKFIVVDSGLHGTQFTHHNNLRQWRIEHDYPWTRRLPEKIPTKGIIFLGCSFTWGQGLYYYSNLDSLREPPPDCYDTNLVSVGHIKFLESVRFARIVANHFNTFEVVAPFNGGSNESAIKWCIDRIFSDPDHHYKPSEFSEFSHVVFQLTQPERKHIFIEHKGFRLDIHNHLHLNGQLSQHEMNILTDYLLEKNMTMDDFCEYIVQTNLNEVKAFLLALEDKGIKTYIMSWPESYVPYIKNDEFLSKRHITFTYKNSTFDCMETAMSKHKELVINGDYEEFTEPPKDHHPSLKAHKLFANSIIKKMEEHE